MGRPPARELTERELEVMQAVWRLGGTPTVADVRDELSHSGLKRAYTTVATLVKILADKGFLDQIGAERPFHYRAVQTYEDVSRRLLGDVLKRVFRGSREQMILRLFEQRRLTARERALLEEFLREPKP